MLWLSLIKIFIVVKPDQTFQPLTSVPYMQILERIKLDRLVQARPRAAVEGAEGAHMVHLTQIRRRPLSHLQVLKAMVYAISLLIFASHANNLDILLEIVLTLRPNRLPLSPHAVARLVYVCILLPR